MTIIADLHVHTTASDGLLSPSAIVGLAESAGLAAIAVTDHDTVSGIEEAIAAARGKHVEVVPGIELSTEYQNKEIHILGFFIDYSSPALARLLEKLHQSRFVRAEKMVGKLRTLGYHINLDEVLQYAKDAAPGRPHVARVLVEKGYHASVAETFAKLLSYNMPGYVERYKLFPNEAIAIIKKAGGIAAWAHPGLTSSDTLLREFISEGLQGLEAYHPDHSRALAEHYKRLAGEAALFITGGSDFHGKEAGQSRDLGDYGLSATEFGRIKDLWKKVSA